ncbi:MAG: hypothetical protein JW789_00785 [Candidatus Aenigmarchaeota archaeon]|nr:hypothetical protein [Candidatus Aenigmarchaeota archaeon]
MATCYGRGLSEAEERLGTINSSLDSIEFIYTNHSMKRYLPMSFKDVMKVQSLITDTLRIQNMDYVKREATDPRKPNDEKIWYRAGNTIMHANEIHTKYFSGRSIDDVPIVPRILNGLGLI